MLTEITEHVLPETHITRHKALHSRELSPFVGSKFVEVDIVVDGYIDALDDGDAPVLTVFDHLPGHDSGVAYEESVYDDVAVVVEDNAVGGETVAPCPAGFLIVVFHAARHVVVYDEPNVGLVDAHAEGICRNNHISLSAQPVALGFFAFFKRHSAVIVRDGESVHLEFPRQRFHSAAREAVDDAAFSPVSGEERGEGGPFVFYLLYLKVEIRPVEAGRQDVGLAELQVVYDVAADLGVCGRGEGRDDRPCWERFDKVRYLHIFRPELSAPEGDAVGFVDAEEGDPDFLGKCAELRRR